MESIPYPTNCPIGMGSGITVWCKGMHNDLVLEAPGHWRGQINIERCTGLSCPCRKETMKVYVIGYNGLGLAPTTPRKARILLKSGRAEIAFRQPFTIRLLYKTGCAHPKEMVVGIDTGSQHIGVAVVNKENTQVISKEEYELRSSMEKRQLLETRKTYRGGRRYRKTRYRHPKFRPKTKRTYVEKAFKKKGCKRHWKKEKTKETSSTLRGKIIN